MPILKWNLRTAEPRSLGTRIVILLWTLTLILLAVALVDGYKGQPPVRSGQEKATQTEPSLVAIPSTQSKPIAPTEPPASSLAAPSSSLPVPTHAPARFPASPRRVTPIALAASGPIGTNQPEQQPRDDGFSACPPFQHLHPYLPGVVINGEIQPYQTWEDDGNTLIVWDGLCHDNDDKPVLPHGSQLPKPFHPDPKERWL